MLQQTDFQKKKIKKIKNKSNTYIDFILHRLMFLN